MKKKCHPRRRPKPKRRRKLELKSIIDYLPEDALCQIFSHLDDIDLGTTSLVCKQFCSLSSPIVRGLCLRNTSLTYSDFDRLFKRFPDVKEIYIYHIHKLDNALSAISKSDLNLEKLQLLLEYPVKAQYPEASTIENMSMSRVIKGIKSLKLGWLDGTATELQVIEFINLFPSLTELMNLNIGYQWKDKLIHKVTSKLPNLRKISLNYNDVVTDETLVILSTNCPKLESVDFRWCKKFTPEALYTFFCNNPQLSSVLMPEFQSPTFYQVSKVVQSMQVLKNLNHLSLESGHLEDAVLIALAESRHPLKNLLIDHSMSQKYTMDGLSKLLSAYPGLESLDIHLPYRKRKNCETQDAEMSIIVKRLPNLKHITVCSRIVCQATLFSLVQNCPLLETIVIERDVGHLNAKDVCDHGMERPTKKNYSIKSIQISPKSNIWLQSMVESYCPKLRTGLVITF